MNFKKLWCVSLTSVLILLIALSCIGCAPAQPTGGMPEFIQIVGISGVGGYYDEQHMTLAELIRTKFPEVGVRTLPGSSEEIVREMEGGGNDISVTVDSYIYDCQESKGKFEGETAFTKLNTLGGWPLGTTTVVLAVRADSDIQDICDIRGKRVALGAKGSLVPTYYEVGLKEFCGFSLEDIEKAGGLVYWGGASEARDMLAAGELDAARADAHPDAQLQLLHAREGIRIISFSEDQWKWIADNMRGVTYYYRPADTYEGIPKFYGGATSMTFIVSADLSEDAVYNLAKTIYSDEGIQFFIDRCGTFKGLTVDDVRQQGIMRLNNPPAPIHPGAIKYWKEQGAL